MKTTPEQVEAISRKMKMYQESGNMDARNALVPKWRECYRNCDWGFKVGDLVRCPIDSKRKVFEIYEITEENTFYIRNIDNENDTIHTYGMLIEKYEKEPEQLTLF